jgi:hypothetical protein
MTPSPSVADFLGTAATGAPGVFPNDITLAFNPHIRHHMVHFPDIVVRPGGMTFLSGHTTSVPQADRYFYPPEVLQLELRPNKRRVKLGEPLSITWQLTNNGPQAITIPGDLRVEAQHVAIGVTSPHGKNKRMPSFVIQTDGDALVQLKPGEGAEGDSMLFWSSSGFAFETPGMHTIDVQIQWNDGGRLYGVTASADVWVDYPVTEKDNEVASLLMHHEVGTFVALGGGATHLKEATARIAAATARQSDHPACACIADLQRGKKQREISSSGTRKKEAKSE